MAGEPYFESVSFMDRPRLAVANLYRGDVAGAGTALADPQQLSPRQMGWIEENGDWKPKGNTVYDATLRTITNPIVLVGALLASKWPVAKAAKLIDYSKSMDRYAKHMPKLVAAVRSFGSLFEGTEVKRLSYELFDWLRDFKVARMSEMTEGIRAAEQNLGRSLTYQDQIAAYLARERAFDSPRHQVWGILRSEKLGQQALYLQKYGLEGFQQAMARGDAEIEAKLARSFREINPGSVYAAAPQELVDALGKIGQETWKEVEAHAPAFQERQRALINQLRALNIEDPMLGLTSKEAAIQHKALEEWGLYRENYVPRVHLGTPEGYDQYLASIIKQSAGNQAMRPADLTQATKRLLKDLGGSVPSFDDLAMMKDHLTPESMEVLDAIKTMAAKYPGVQLMPRQYSLRSVAVMEHYADAMGKVIGWTGKGYGRLLEDEAEKLHVLEPGGKVRYNLLKETYFPLMSGRLDASDAMYALEWGHYKQAAHDFFAKEGVRKAISGETADFFRKQLEKPVIQNLTWKNAGAKVASWFYLSTLGANLSPVGLNLMQNLMTTPGLVEARYLGKGAMSAARMAQDYVDIVAQGNSLDEAWRLLTEKNPHLAHVYNSVESEVMETIRRAKTGGANTLGDRIDQAKTLMMSLFSTTERFNKVVAFEAGRIKALDEGLDQASSLLVGREVMNRTQFPGGPFGTPSALVKTWAPFRQFTQFPLRTMELMTSSPGVAGRMMAAGGLLYEGGRAAGTDLSRGLVFGALPTPYSEDQPFYPFPMAPPLLNLAGSVASDVFSSDPSALAATRRMLPTLVPGGVGMARMATSASPTMARMIGRPYADFSAVRPDGTIPLYSSQGNLVGFKRPVDLFADAIGWTSLTGSPVNELEGYLVKQRDKIREARRQYVEALASNDMAGAQRINDQYKRAYPQLGDIVIKQQDIQAVHLRHDVSRVERILQTMPSDTRGMYGQMVGVALGETAGSFTGVDPDLLAGGTVTSRNPSRVVPTGPRAQMLDRNRQMMQSGVPGLQSESGFRLRSDQSGTKVNAGPFGSGFDGFAEW